MNLRYSSIEFSEIQSVVLLGGGEILKEIAKIILNCNKKVKIVTSSRQYSENIGEGSLETFLKVQKIEHLVVEKLKMSELKEFLGYLDETISISIGAAWIFSDEIINGVFHNKLVNLHGTRLPQNRGGGGFSWQILTGNRFGFVTLHLIDQGIDTGPIIDQQQFLYPATCRIPEDFSKIYKKYVVEYFTEFFQKIFSSKLIFDLKIQNENLSTYWPRLNTELHSWIDWSQNPRDLERFICAFDSPYSGSKTMLNKDEVRLKCVSLNFEDGIFHRYQSGIIYRTNPHWICVALAGCSLIVEQVLNKENVNIINKIKVGDRFYTPQKEIEIALTSRVHYTANGLNTNC